MGFVDRLRTGKHLKTLRSADRASAEALSDANFSEGLMVTEEADYVAGGESLPL